MQTLHAAGLASILLLAVTAFLLPLPLFRNPVAASRLSRGTLALVAAFQLLAVVDVAQNGTFRIPIGHYEAPFGIVFRIGPVETAIGLLFALVAGAVVWYAAYTLEAEIGAPKVRYYHALLHLLLASLLGTVFTGDLFNAFVFVEISTLSACGLIAIKDKPDTIKATIKYLVLSSLGSGLVLMGIALLYSATGHLSMEPIRDFLAVHAGENENLLLVSLTLFVVGLGIKSALFPLHIWLPDAHTAAPGPSSAILSGLVLKAPAILLVKILYDVYGAALLEGTVILPLLLGFGAAGMLAGSLLARVQTDLKRMIAYSSVAQMGYIFFGAGLGNALGLLIAFYHCLAHGLTKSCLFLSASSIIEQTGQRDIRELRGIGKEMPLTMALFTVNALSMVGIPILPGFISKWNLSLAAIESGRLALLLVILASSLLNISYYFPIILNAFFGNANLEGKVYHSKSKPVRELLPLVLLTLAVVLAGFASGPILDWLQAGLPALGGAR